MVKRKRGWRRRVSSNEPIHNPHVSGQSVKPRFSEELMHETREVWQPYYPEPLSDEDCCEIVENMATFARLLLHMER